MKLPPPIREVPADRKVYYYAGMGLSVFGLLLFLSTFVSFAMNFGNFERGFEQRAGGMFLRAILGMVLMMAGGVVMNIGARGWAGSGLKLDPEQARRDLEPFARASGGLTDAAFQEMPTVRETLSGLRAGSSDLDPGPPREIVKVRCPTCRTLNDEGDRYCGQCGAKLFA